jgi:uncharacterized protein (DUF1697 family)
MQYIALLRGIGPTNPNMRNEKLRGVFEQLGFRNVRSVISSGNVIFESSSKNVKVLGAKLERVWPEKLGFKSTTIIRSQQYIEKLIASKPFKNKEHSRESYLLVTFLKTGTEVFSTIDVASTGTPNFMAQLEKKYGKEITTRTWKTVLRIQAAFNKK